MTTATAPNRSYTVHLRRPHAKQAAIVDCVAKRIVVRAGRRWGKTTVAATRAAKRFLAGRRQLYATPTQEQVDAFWWEVKRALAEPLEAGALYKNESLHIIEMPGTKIRIRAKTAWNADTLRGDYADDLYLDEWQLMDEDAWELVGAPMLLDNDGDAVFIYTPPSLHSRSISKARDPRHAARMFKRAQEDTSGRWAAFHFTSRDNPHISETALRMLEQDMTALARRQEIEAEDIDEAPGAPWTRMLLAGARVSRHPDLARVIVGVDPPGGVTECGIIVAGTGPCSCHGEADNHGFVLEDRSLQGSPDTWGAEVLTAYNGSLADRVVGEANYGGDMVESTVRQAAKARSQRVSYKAVRATRGKAVRAEPVVALYEQGRVHHVGEFPALEDEMCTWSPGQSALSPNRMDALVWALTELMLGPEKQRPEVIA